MANALDSGASHVTLNPDPASASLTVIDDGAGMKRRELSRYHDVAASAKARGQGIGFAGVGIKLGLLACREVVTDAPRSKERCDPLAPGLAASRAVKVEPAARQRLRQRLPRQACRTRSGSRGRTATVWTSVSKSGPAIPSWGG